MILFDIFHGKVEPESGARAAGIRPHEEVVLQLSDVVCPAQVPALEGRVETQLAPLGLAAVSRRPHDQPVEVAETAFTIAFFTV